MIREADALAHRAAVLNDMGRHAEALEVVDTALTGSPEHVELLVQAAVALDATGRWHDAELPCREALRLSPDDLRAWRLLAHILTRTGDLDGAFTAVSTAVTLAPADPFSLLAMSHVETARGRRASAVEAAERALELAPGLDAAHLQLATALTTGRRRPSSRILRQAEQHVRQVLRDHPDDAAVLEALARVKALRNAPRVDPLDPGDAALEGHSDPPEGQAGPAGPARHESPDAAPRRSRFALRRSRTPEPATPDLVPATPDLVPAAPDLGPEPATPDLPPADVESSGPGAGHLLLGHVAGLAGVWALAPRSTGSPAVVAAAVVAVAVLGVVVGRLSTAVAGVPGPAARPALVLLVPAGLAVLVSPLLAGSPTSGVHLLLLLPAVLGLLTSVAAAVADRGHPRPPAPS